MFWNSSFKKRYADLDTESPFPGIELEISHCFISDKLSLCSFTIDTGATLTCINEEIFYILDLEYHGKQDVEYADGIVEEKDTCLIDLRFPKLGFKEPKLEVIIHPNESENLLGRDILNKMSVFLYGTKRMFKIRV